MPLITMISLWIRLLVQYSRQKPVSPCRAPSCFILIAVFVGRYDGDVYNGLLERAQWSPLNRADVLPLFEKVRHPRSHPTLIAQPHPHNINSAQIIKTNRAGFGSDLASKL
jgi:hypothetical protein